MAIAMTSRTLTERSGVELAAAIRSGETSARDVVDAHIEVLERVNPRINAGRRRRRPR
jgi:fatty acid amide hydrolase 2